MNWMRHYLHGLWDYTKDYVLENTGLKVLALLITAVLWLSVASRPVSQVTFSNVPIEFRNLPETPPLIPSKYDASSARVYLEGPRDVLDSLRPSAISVVADMSKVEPGVRVIGLKLDSSLLPASVHAREISPISVRVTVERTIEKEVAVIPRFDGQPRPGYEMINWQMTPAAVRISGAESTIRDITQVSTETVSLSDRTGSFNSQVKIDLGEVSSNVSLADESGRKVMLTVNIGELRKERVFDHVPVTVSTDSTIRAVTPEFVKVRVFGARSVIDAMTPDDISVRVEVTGKIKPQDQFTPEVIISPAYADKVEVRSIDPQKVRVR